MIGQTLSHYRILSRLGQGGMGEVYLAEDTLLHRNVAIKVMRPEIAGETATGRLVREAQSAAALDHPYICAIHEIGAEGGRPFIVMQYVLGETLADRLARGPLHLREVLDIAVPIADALSEAHRHGIVHRDIKPQNIMIGSRGQVKVMDFGLAKPMAVDVPESEAHTRTALTDPGMIAGTVAYMSPEQARGDRSLDARSDIFSYGILLYEMLTGRQPFAAGSTAETLSAILSRVPELVARYQSETPPELERIVGKALRKDREERYQDIKDLALDLAALREEMDFRERASRPRSSDPAATAAPALSPARATPRARGRSRAPLAAAAVVVAAALAYAYWHRSNLAWAAASVPRVEQLAQSGDYAAAHTLALRVQAYRPDDAELKRLVAAVSDDLSVATEPSGAEVTVRRFGSGEGALPPTRVSLGRTPLSHAMIARGDYILRLELSGHEPFEGSVSSSVTRANAEFRANLSPAIQITQRLFESGQAPAGMVPVPAGAYKLIGYGQIGRASCRERV